MTLRAALYCRVSTDEQALEGYSIDAQKTKLASYCEFQIDESGGQAFRLQKVYVDDGYSGKTSNRPAYRKMMAEIDEWDAMIVLKMDRIHRNSANFMKMMEVLNRKGKQFVSATEDLDTSNAMGRFVMSMIQSIAQLESEQIGERTFMGMRQKAETMRETVTGRTMGFSPPYGYRFEDNVLVSVPEELSDVEYMFSRCAEGVPMEQIANDLNHGGSRTRRDGVWTKTNISAAVHNPIYAGYVRWQELTYPHNAETAVDIDTFNRTQLAIAGRIRDPAKRNPLLLSEDGKLSKGSA